MSGGINAFSVKSLPNYDMLDDVGYPAFTMINKTAFMMINKKKVGLTHDQWIRLSRVLLYDQDLSENMHLIFLKQKDAVEDQNELQWYYGQWYHGR